MNLFRFLSFRPGNFRLEASRRRLSRKWPSRTILLVFLVASIRGRLGLHRERANVGEGVDDLLIRELRIGTIRDAGLVHRIVHHAARLHESDERASFFDGMKVLTVRSSPAPGIPFASMPWHSRQVLRKTSRPRSASPGGTGTTSTTLPPPPQPERAKAVRRNAVIVYRSGLTKGTGVLSGARRIDVTMSITRIPL